MSFWFLYDNPEKLELEKDNLDNELKFLLDSDKFSWDKIYLFSAFVRNPAGVEQVKKILEHRSLNKNTEVVIAIGTKNYFNKPSDIQEILTLSKSPENKTNFVKFICPKTINDESPINENFHIKAYCFLGSMKGKGSKIGFSIIGSSNLTKAGLEGKGELCISIRNLNLTKELIYRLSNKYISKSPHISKSPPWDQEIIEEYAREKYNKEQSRQDQDEVLQLSKENSTPVNQSEPRPGKFIKLGVLTDSVLLAKATTLVNGRDMGCFHSIQTIDEEKNDVPKNYLCLLSSTENKIFRIVEIGDHSSYQENPEGCFVTYKENVTYELSDDILEILANEKYKIISDAQDMEELRYKTLKDLEEEVKEYQEYQKMLDDPKYQKWLEKGKKKMQKMQSEITEINRILELEIAPSLMKEQIKKILQSI
ncbi:phospholipase D family protein [Microcoleus sp. K5-D4]|uniref:phospholipase D family protein n=1 Tax=Microcoleus sp. K5-D4 TaxID=2818801 RepID=UPI002FD4617D